MTTAKDIYIGDGTTVEFPVTFEVDRPQDITVFLKLVDETEKRQVRNQDYVVRQEDDGTYTVVMRNDDYRDPPAAGVMVVIQLDMPFTQPSGRAGMSAHVFKTRIDSVTKNFRQLRERLDRTLHVGQAYPDYALRSPVYLTDPYPYIVAVGTGKVMRSRNGVDDWQQVSLPLALQGQNWIGALYHAHTERFLIITSSGNVARSTDRSGVSFGTDFISSAGLSMGGGWDSNPTTGTILSVNSGTLYRSTNAGTSWSTSTPFGGLQTRGCKYVTWLNRWVVHGGADLKRVWTSDDDGLSWTERTTGLDSSPSMHYLAYSPTAITSADSAGGGAGRVYRSTDLTSWSQATTTGLDGTRAGNAWGNGIFVQVGSASATFRGSRSVDDGVTWTGTLSGDFLLYSYIDCIFVQRLNKFIAMVINGGPSGTAGIIHSSDGASWSFGVTPHHTGGWTALASDSPADLD